MLAQIQKHRQPRLRGYLIPFLFGSQWRKPRKNLAFLALSTIVFHKYNIQLSFNLKFFIFHGFITPFFLKFPLRSSIPAFSFLFKFYKKTKVPEGTFALSFQFHSDASAGVRWPCIGTIPVRPRASISPGINNSCSKIPGIALKKASSRNSFQVKGLFFIPISTTITPPHTMRPPIMAAIRARYRATMHFQRDLS